MPRYSYYCESCETVSKVFHSMSTVLQECPQCLAQDGFYKMLSKPSYNKSKNTKEEPKEKVEQHIQEAREQLDKQKRNMRNEELVEK